MSKPKISVIVAVYNAEKTLKRLIDSLACQTMPDFEVLLIDDGSTDSSGDICDIVSNKDSRFKVFHKQNEGIGTTRQFGIENASADYTIHADADDWVEPDYLEMLYDKAVSTGTDMVICDFIEENGKQSLYVKQEPKKLSNDELALEFLKLHGGPWNKLIKRSAYINAGIRYVDGLNYGEDKVFNMQLALSGILISYVPKALYHYDTASNPDSAVHEISLKQISNREKYISILREMLPADRFEYELDLRNLDIVYLAIHSKAFSKEQFRQKYSFLSKIRWKDYPFPAFSIKLIIWTSLHGSYRLALLFCGIKKTVRRIKTAVAQV